MFTKLGQELQSAREKARMSVGQLAAKIKIDPKFVHLMEKGDFEFLPDLYVKAFVKEYADVVGLDPNTYARRFEKAMSGGKDEEVEETPAEKEQQSEAQPAQQVKQKSEEEPKKKTGEENKPDARKQEKKKEEKKTEEKKPEPRRVEPAKEKRTITDDSSLPADKAVEAAGFWEANKLILIVLLLIVAAGAVIYFTIFHKPQAELVRERPYEEIVEETIPRYGEETETTAIEELETISAVSADSLTLGIFASDTSWCQVVIDDNITSEYTLFPNTSMSIKAADSFDLIIGNSGGIRLTLDNEPLEFQGRENVRRLVTVTSDGIVSDQ